jgi:hypothetical protein
VGAMYEWGLMVRRAETSAGDPAVSGDEASS